MSTDNTNNNKAEISNKIRQWLQEEGYDFNPFEDPYNDFCFEIKTPDDDVILIGMRKDRKDSITIYARSDLSKLDRQAFSTLHTHTKDEFVYAFTSSLLGLNLLFDILPNIEHMEYLQIQKCIFFDGLTKNLFFDTIDRVLAGKDLARIAYFKYLAKPEGSDTSLRCLFL